METARLIVCIILIIFGLLYIIRPDLAFRFRTFTARKLFGVKVIPGKRTYLAYRITGVALILVGVYVLYSN